MANEKRSEKACDKPKSKPVEQARGGVKFNLPEEKRK